MPVFKINQKSRVLRSVFFAAVVIALAGGAACRTARENPLPAARIIIDDLGNRVALPANVTRAVSLAPNLTEIVFAVGAGDRLVGDTTYCNFPIAAQKIEKVSDTQTPNLEKIVALRPQIVFVSTASQLENFTDILNQQNIGVFVTDPKDLDGVYRSIAAVGEVFGENENARRTIDEMKSRAANVAARIGNAPPVKTFVQIDKNSLYTIGKESFMTDLIARAGGVSVTAELPTGYPKISKETALALAPDAIILSANEANAEPNEIFRNSPAVKNGRVFSIDADLLSRPGPRLIDGLEQIAKALHTEKYQ